MQDIRQAIAVAGNPVASPSDRNAALEYCNSVKCSPGSWRVCCEMFRTSEDASVRFWCLSSLLEILQNSWSSLDADSQLAVRAFALEYMRQQVSGAYLDSNVFILNKFGQLVAVLVACTFPRQWPDLFEAMLANFSAAPSPATVDMFLRVMSAVDEDIICGGLDFPRETYQAALSMQVKDGLRETSIARIFDVWMTIICQCGDSNSIITSATLSLIGRYIAWADIGLVVNEKVLPILFRCCSIPPLMPDALKCLAAVVLKKMDYASKISVMLQINVPAALQQLTANQSLAQPYAPLVAAVCKETVACISKSIDDVTLVAAASAAAQILNADLPCLIGTLQSCSDASAESALELLKEFLALLKKVGTLADGDRAARPQLQGLEHMDAHLHSMLNAICTRLCLPLDFDFDDSVGDDNADSGYRQELLTVYKSIARLRPQNVRPFVLNFLSAAVRDPSHWSRCEVAVLLFFEMGEVFPADTSKAGEGDVAATMQLLLEARVWDWPAPQLQSTVMETVLRYFRFFAAAPSYLPPVLAAFTDVRGILSPSEALRRRAAYIFMKLCKSVSKTDPKKLADVMPHVCAAVMPVFEMYLSFDAVKVHDHDTRVQCAEALGIVIGSSGVPAPTKVAELVRFMAPFTQVLGHINTLNLAAQSESGPGSDAQKWIERTCLIADVISSVCKGLSRAASELWPQLEGPIVCILQLILKAPAALFAAAVCFLPRIIDLGPACLQATYPALESMLASITDCSRFLRIVSVMSQISCLYKSNSFPALSVLAANAQYRLEVIVGPPHVLPVTHTSRDHVTSEAQREAAEAYCTIMALFCSMMATAPAGSFAQPAAAMLLMKFVEIASAIARHTSDVPCLKQAVALSRRAMDHVASSPHLQEALSRLVEMAAFTAVSIPLHAAFDATDAQSALLLQDAGALYMTLKAASGGAAFAQFVCQRVLPVLALQPNEIEALIPVLLGDDQKVLAQALVTISQSRRTRTH